MKKIICILLSVLVLSTSSFAQDKTNKKAEKKEKTTKKENTKKAESNEPVKPAAEMLPTTTKTKKDGTPDMRYKENKENKTKEEGKKKKDGTPDMRYKENKKK